MINKQFQKEKVWAAFVAVVFVLLTITAFFANDFVLYDFHMNVSDYSYEKTNTVPKGAATSFWFDYGTHGRNLFYGYTEQKIYDDALFYIRTSNGIQTLKGNDMPDFANDALGNLVASLPVQHLDLDGDGEKENVYDFARADFGNHAFEPVPQRFDSDEIPFELVFAERNQIEVRFENRQLIEAEISIVNHNGQNIALKTDENGWIEGLSQRDIRYGFTAIYQPDEETVYRMYYALEDYPFFSWHTLEAHLPLLLVLGLAFLLIFLIEMTRRSMFKNDKTYMIQAKRTGILKKNHLNIKTKSRYLMIRWILMWFGMFTMTYMGKMIGQGQVANQVSVPVFACPFNLDQAVEVAMPWNRQD